MKDHLGGVYVLNANSACSDQCSKCYQKLVRHNIRLIYFSCDVVHVYMHDESTYFKVYVHNVHCDLFVNFIYELSVSFMQALANQIHLKM